MEILEKRSESGAPFSEILNRLNQHALSGFMIKRIAIADGGREILLEGVTDSSRKLMGFLRYLNGVDLFNGQVFTVISLSEPTSKESLRPFKLSSYSQGYVPSARSKTVESVSSSMNQYLSR